MNTRFSDYAGSCRQDGKPGCCLYIRFCGAPCRQLPAAGSFFQIKCLRQYRGEIGKSPASLPQDFSLLIQGSPDFILFSLLCLIYRQPYLAAAVPANHIRRKILLQVIAALPIICTGREPLCQDTMPARRHGIRHRSKALKN